MLAAAIVVLLAAGITALVTTGEEPGPERVTRTSLAAARARWTTARPPGGYSWRYDLLCRCGPPLTYEVEVDAAGTATAVRPMWSSPSSRPPPTQKRVWTVESLFEEVQRAIDADAARVMVSFDPVLGFPDSFVVDADRRAPAIFGVAVVDFMPRG